jgi:hypothetical protein
MTYLEVILLIQERSEKVVSDKTLTIQTDKHAYYRMPDGSWEERIAIPPVVSTLTLAPVEEKKKKDK